MYETTCFHLCAIIGITYFNFSHVKSFYSTLWQWHEIQYMKNDAGAVQYNMFIVGDINIWRISCGILATWSHLARITLADGIFVLFVDTNITSALVALAYSWVVISEFRFIYEIFSQKVSLLIKFTNIDVTISVGLGKYILG